MSNTRKGLGVGLALLLALAVILGSLRSPEPTQAQGGGNLLTNYVLLLFSNYVGISPPLTAAELETGNLSRSFDASYRQDGLDLTVDPLSCDSRVMEDDEIITNGRVGFRYLITLQRRTYEFRSNITGEQIIRCYFGEPIDFIGNARGIGTTISGDQAVNIGLQHAKAYLEIPQVLNIDKANNPDEDTPYTVYYWIPYVYLDASLGCAQRGFTYDVRDTFAFRVQVSVAGRYFDYRVRGDGGQVIWCRGGVPDTTSIGLDLGRTAIATATATP